jgi:hypothetical protein
MVPRPEKSGRENSRLTNIKSEIGAMPATMNVVGFQIP